MSYFIVGTRFVLGYAIRYLGRLVSLGSFRGAAVTVLACLCVACAFISP